MAGRRPSPVKDVIAAALRDAGVADRVARAAVVLEWPEHVGPQIAAVTAARAIGLNGTLFVTVATSAWMMELKLMEASLVQTLNRGRRSGRVRRIIWQVGSIEASPPRSGTSPN